MDTGKKIVVVGLGEVGKPLLQLLSETYWVVGVDVAPRLRTLKVQEPPKRKGGAVVKSVDELVAKLKNEAKAIP